MLYISLYIMSLIPQLIPIEVNSENIKNIVLTNTIKMLTERKLLSNENLEKNIKKIINTQNDDFIYKIEYENNIPKDNKYIIIKILNQKITATNKTSEIGEFLSKYKTEHKIVIVKSINNKTRQMIVNIYPNTEVFLEKELMINIIEHVYIPKHEILSDDEGILIIDSYNTRKRDMPKIFNTDPVARYYNMQPGQICRILRASETSGFVPFYRLVIKGHISSE